MSYIALVARFFVDPQRAVAGVFAAQPLGRALGAAIAATAIYQSILCGLGRDVAAIRRLGAFDRGAMAIVLDQIEYVIPAALAYVVVISVVYVPVRAALLRELEPGGRGHTPPRGSSCSDVAVALSLWVATLVVWTLPAAIFAEPYIDRSVAVWATLPLMFFACAMTVVLTPSSGAGHSRAAVASVVGGLSLALGPLGARLVALVPTGGKVGLALVSAAVLAIRLVRRDTPLPAEPETARAHVDAGLACEERGDSERALSHYRHAVALDPTDLEALYRLGTNARSRGALPEAIARFDEVLQLDDEYSRFEVWREVGATYYSAGQFSDAREALERFVERRPSDPEGLYLLGRTLGALGEEEQARERMLEVIALANAAGEYSPLREARWLPMAEAYLKGERE